MVSHHIVCSNYNIKRGVNGAIDNLYTFFALFLREHVTVIFTFLF